MCASLPSKIFLALPQRHVSADTKADLHCPTNATADDSFFSHDHCTDEDPWHEKCHHTTTELAIGYDILALFSMASLTAPVGCADLLVDQ